MKLICENLSDIIDINSCQSISDIRSRSYKLYVSGMYPKLLKKEDAEILLKNNSWHILHPILMELNVELIDYEYRNGFVFPKFIITVPETFMVLHRKYYIDDIIYSANSVKEPEKTIDSEIKEDDNEVKDYKNLDVVSDI